MCDDPKLVFQLSHLDKFGVTVDCGFDSLVRIQQICFVHLLISRQNILSKPLQQNNNFVIAFIQKVWSFFSTWIDNNRKSNLSTTFHIFKPVDMGRSTHQINAAVTIKTVDVRKQKKCAASLNDPGPVTRQNFDGAQPPLSRVFMVE